MFNSSNISGMKAKQAYLEGLTASREKLVTHLRDIAMNLPYSYSGFTEEHLEIVESMSEISDMIISVSELINENSSINEQQ